MSYLFIINKNVKRVTSYLLHCTSNIYILFLFLNTWISIYFAVKFHKQRKSTLNWASNCTLHGQECGAGHREGNKGTNRDSISRDIMETWFPYSCSPCAGYDRWDYFYRIICVGFSLSPLMYERCTGKSQYFHIICSIRSLFNPFRSAAKTGNSQLKSSVTRIICLRNSSSEKLDIGKFKFASTSQSFVIGASGTPGTLSPFLVRKLIVFCYISAPQMQTGRVKSLWRDKRNSEFNVLIKWQTV